jgi:tetratricopeptide (TPR) repeat protein
MSLGSVSEARKEVLAILERCPTQDEAMLLLADIARTQEEISETEERLHRFDERTSTTFYLASASLYLRKGDLSSAESAVQQALTLDPKLPAAHIAMGNLHWLRGDRVRAAEEFKTAAGLAPIRSVERLKYADFEAKTGRIDDAGAMLNEITRQAPDYLPAWGRLAQIAFAEKNYDQSLALLENVFNRDGANFEAGMLKAEVWLAKGEVKQALEILARLDKAYPNVPPVKYQLARAYLLNKDPGQATALLNQAVARNADFTEAILLLGEVKLHAGDAQGVVDSMNGLLQKHPHLTQAQILLAAAYQALGRPDDAADIFRSRIRIAPQDAEAQFRLGLILRQQNKIADARDAFEKAAALEPESLQVVQQLVELDILSKDFISALERVRRQREKTSDSATAEFLEGKIYAAQDRRDRAEVALLRALQLDPSFSSASELLISTYIASNRLNEAVGQLQSTLSKNPNDVWLLMSSASVYEKMGRYSDARDAYEKVLSASRDSLPALKSLASLYATRLNQLDRAYDLARKARSLAPEDAEISDALGWILCKRADYEQALTLLNESTAKNFVGSERQGLCEEDLHKIPARTCSPQACSQVIFGKPNSAGRSQFQNMEAILGHAANSRFTIPPIKCSVRIPLSLSR